MTDLATALILTNRSGILCEPRFEGREALGYPCGLSVHESSVWIAGALEPSEIEIVKGAHLLAHYLDGLRSDGANGLHHDYKSAGNAWYMDLTTVTFDDGETYKIVHAMPRMPESPDHPW